MEITLESLAGRVADLERELADMKQRDIQRLIEETPAERGARLLRQSRANGPLWAALAERTCREMGVPFPPPMTVEELHAQMLAEGVRPEDNLLSRGIIEARGE